MAVYTREPEIMLLFNEQQESLAMKTHPAFAELYATYHGKIRNYLTGLVGVQLAEDLCQEVFTKVNINLQDFRGGSSVSTWIYRIASNTAKDHFRSAVQKQKQYEIPVVEDFNPDQAMAAQTTIPLATDKKVIRKEMQACIREFVARLPPDYREVVMLSEFEEFSNKEIGEILDISLENVKIRLHRGRAMLKEIFNKGCELYFTDQNEIACDRKQLK